VSPLGCSLSHATLIPSRNLQGLRLPELLAHAAQGEAERKQVALELLRRDEKRGKGLAADAAEAERLPIALARLEHRTTKLLRGHRAGYPSLSDGRSSSPHEAGITRLAGRTRGSRLESGRPDQKAPFESRRTNPGLNRGLSSGRQGRFSKRLLERR
jgi:hypothetical protein